MIAKKNLEGLENRVIQKVPQRETKCGWSFFKKTKLQEPILVACHVVKPILRVGWNFQNLLFPPLNMPMGPRIVNPGSTYARLSWPTHPSKTIQNVGS